MCNLPEVIILRFQPFGQRPVAALQQKFGGQSFNENALGSTCTAQRHMR
jgi:hypothetical protein